MIWFPLSGMVSNQKMLPRFFISQSSLTYFNASTDRRLLWLANLDRNSQIHGVCKIVRLRQMEVVVVVSLCFPCFYLTQNAAGWYGVIKISIFGSTRGWKQYLLVHNSDVESRKGHDYHLTFENEYIYIYIYRGVNVRETGSDEVHNPMERGQAKMMKYSQQLHNHKTTTIRMTTESQKAICQRSQPIQNV